MKKPEEYWSQISQARFARERGEYQLAMFLLGQARCTRVRGSL